MLNGWVSAGGDLHEFTAEIAENAEKGAEKGIAGSLRSEVY